MFKLDTENLFFGFVVEIIIELDPGLPIPMFDDFIDIGMEIVMEVWMIIAADTLLEVGARWTVSAFIRLMV